MVFLSFLFLGGEVEGLDRVRGGGGGAGLLRSTAPFAAPAGDADR
jgi:hypothetical protein